MTENKIRIASDLSSCSIKFTSESEMELPAPMANLMKLLPPVDKPPYYITKVEAEKKLN